MSLVGKNLFILHAVGVGHGELIFQVVGNAVAVGVDLPGGSIDGVSGHGFRNFGIPTAEDVAGAGGSAVESGRCSTGQQASVILIGKNLFILHAVGVGDGICIAHIENDVHHVSPTVFQSPVASIVNQSDGQISAATGSQDMTWVRSVVLIYIAARVNGDDTGILVAFFRDVTGVERTIVQRESRYGMIYVTAYHLHVDQAFDYIAGGLFGFGFALCIDDRLITLNPA